VNARILERKNGLGKKHYTIQFRAWYGWTTHGTDYCNYRFDTIDEARAAYDVAVRSILEATFSKPVVVEIIHTLVSK